MKNLFSKKLYNKMKNFIFQENCTTKHQKLEKFLKENSKKNKKNLFPFLELTTVFSLKTKLKYFPNRSNLPKK